MLWKKREILSQRKLFRQISSLVISFFSVKTLISRNFCQKKREAKFPKFHTTVQIVKEKLTGFPSTKMQRLPSLAM